MDSNESDKNQFYYSQFTNDSISKQPEGWDEIYEEFQREEAKLKEQISELEFRRNRLMVESDALHAQLQETEHKFKILRLKISSAETVLASAKNDFDAAEDEKFNTEIQVFQSRVDRTRKHFTECESQTKWKKQQEELKSEIEALEKNIRDLESEKTVEDPKRRAEEEFARRRLLKEIGEMETELEYYEKIKAAISNKDRVVKKEPGLGNEGKPPPLFDQSSQFHSLATSTFQHLPPTPVAPPTFKPSPFAPKSSFVASSPSPAPRKFGYPSTFEDYPIRSAPANEFQMTTFNAYTDPPLGRMWHENEKADSKESKKENFKDGKKFVPKKPLGMFPRNKEK